LPQFGLESLLQENDEAAEQCFQLFNPQSNGEKEEVLVVVLSKNKVD